jgi:hypothetical protein
VNPLSPETLSGARGWSLAPVLLAEGNPVGKPGDVTVAIVLMGVLILAFAVAGIVIYIVRSRALKADAAGNEVPLTLHDLREMHKRGEIDDDELSRLRTIVLEQARKQRPKPPPPTEP